MGLVLALDGIFGVAAAADEAASALSGTIDYYTWGDAASDKIEQSVIAAFNKHYPNIKVNLSSGSYGAYLDKLVAGIIAGSPPDVALVDGFDYATLAARGQLTDLTALAARDGVRGDQTQPSFWNEMVLNGHLYSIANLRSSRVVLYYNQDLLDQAGLASPYAGNGWTWQDFLTTSKRLTHDDNGDGKNDASGVQMSNWVWPWVWMNDGTLLNADRSRSTLGEPAAYEAIQWLADLRAKQHVVGGNFANQTAAMQITWDTQSIATYRNASFNWDISQLPAGPAGAITTSKGNEVVIPAGAKHPELAWAFAKFLAGEEAQYLYGVQGRFFPPQRQAALRLIQEAQGLKPAHLTVLTTLNARPLPVVAGFSELRKMWDKELAPVFAGTESAKSAGGRVDDLSVAILKAAGQP